MAKSSFSFEELLACAKGTLFGPGNAQLPAPPMLMMDRITHIAEDGGAHDRGQVVAELDIHPDRWFFGCHFPNDPIMPGCLGLDALWQMTGFFLGWLGEKGRGRALGVGEVKFTGVITPAVKLVRCIVDIRRVRRGQVVLALADGSLEADGRQVFTSTGMRVGLFHSDPDV